MLMHDFSSKGGGGGGLKFSRGGGQKIFRYRAFVFIPFNCFQFSLSFILLIKSLLHLYITFCAFIHLNIYIIHGRVLYF